MEIQILDIYHTSTTHMSFNMPGLISLFQLTAAMYEIHEIFFELPVGERMAIISMSRRLKREKLFRPEVEVVKQISILGWSTKFGQIRHFRAKRTTFVLLTPHFWAKLGLLSQMVFGPYAAFFLKVN